MNVPKETKRFCPHCKKRTDQKIGVVGTGNKRGTLARGSLARAKLRNQNSGMGNKGRYSKPAIKSWKRKTKTTTRKVMIFKCKECGKSKIAAKSRRVSKLLVGENKK